MEAKAGLVIGWSDKPVWTGFIVYSAATIALELHRRDVRESETGIPASSGCAWRYGRKTSDELLHRRLTLSHTQLRG